jgi:hypothetical protein
LSKSLMIAGRSVRRVAGMAAVGVMALAGCSTADADHGKLIPTCSWEVQANDQVDGYVVMAMPGRAATCSSLLSQWTSGRTDLWNDPSGDAPHATPVSEATALAGNVVCKESVAYLLSVPVEVSVRANSAYTSNFANNLCVSMQIEN